MRQLRVRLIAFWVVIGLVVALAVGGAVYARSDAPTQLVTKKLSKALGAEVTISEVSVGLSTTVVKQLTIFESLPLDADPTAKPAPWLSVEEATAEMSAIGAVLGNDPKRIVLRNASLTLRFAENGDLLTRLPAAGAGNMIPVIHIASGNLTIRQQGREDTVFRGIDLTLETKDQQLSVSGLIRDQAWGDWKVTGLADLKQRAGSLVLATKEPHAVDPDLLRKTPFVTPDAWRHVGLEGMTTARLEVQIKAEEEHPVSYRVVLQPTKTRVRIPSIGLEVSDATGKVVAVGNDVWLEGVTGRSADGKVRVDSKMTFKKNTSELRFDTQMEDVDADRLPKDWRLPNGFEGRLHGKLDFMVKVDASGVVHTDGKGSVRIDDAKLNGVKTGSITLALRPSPKGGFEFAQGAAAAVPAVPKKIGEDSPGVVSSLLKLAAKVVKPPTATPEDRNYLHLNLAFKDVEIEQLLKSAEIEVPVWLRGKVSLQVQVDVPTDRPGEWRSYRLKGQVRSKRIIVEKLAIEDVQADLDFKDGKLRMTNFVGRFPELFGDTSAGFKAEAELGVGNGYPFRGKITLKDLPLGKMSRLSQLLPAGTSLDGFASVDGSFDGRFGPLQLNSRGSLRFAALKVGDFGIESASARWISDGDSIKVEDVQARLLGGEITGRFDIPLQETAAAGGRLTLKNLDLSQVSKGLPTENRIALEGKADGAVTLRVPAAGEGASRQVTADLELNSAKLKLQNIPAEKIKASAEFNAGVLTYRFTGSAFGGQFEVDGRYPPVKAFRPGEIIPAGEKKTAPLNGDEPPVGERRSSEPPGLLPPPVEKKTAPPSGSDGPTLGRFRLKNAQLSKMLGTLGVTNTLGPLDAEVSGELPLQFDRSARLVGSGKVQFDRLRWGNHTIASAGSGTIRLTQKTLSVEELTFAIGNGLIRSTLSLERDSVDKSTGVVSLTEVPAAKLLFLFPEFAGQLDFPVTGRLTLNVGREWRGTGVLTATRGTIFRVPMADLRISADWTAVPARGRAEIRLREITGTAAEGRMSGRADVQFYSDLPPRLSSSFQLTNFNTGKAFAWVGRVVGSAPVSGKLELNADQLRSEKDLTGSLTLSMGESTPFGLPILSSLVPFLGFGRDITTPVRSGDAKASLGSGVWRIERLTLTGPALDVYAEGTVDLTGRVALNVVGRTAKTAGRDGAAVSRLVRIAGRAVTAPLDPTTIAEATGLLANLTLYLEVGGTIRNPQVRVQALRSLTEDAVRFLLLRYIAI